jgi:transposase InsO family protein
MSDRGTIFLSELVEETFKLMGSKHLVSTAYHPQTQGLVEKVNGILVDMLSMYLNEDHSNWDITLPLITFEYNKSTRFSPFELLYGRKPTFPQDINLEALPSVFRDTDHYMEIMAGRWERIREIAKINVKHAQEKI